MNDQVEPGWLSLENDAAWRASLRAQKESERAQFAAADKLHKMWERAVLGVENSSSRERNAERLPRVLPELIVWPLTAQAAEAYGQIAADLRRTGRPIGKMDMLIAAIALSLSKITVASADRDLTAAQG